MERKTNVVGFIGAYEYFDPNSAGVARLAIVTEYYTGKDLLFTVNDFWRRRGELTRAASETGEGGGSGGGPVGVYSEYLVAVIMKKLATALLALHEAGIIHR